MQERLLITRLDERVWNLCETKDGVPNVDGYVVIGTERAVLIDALRNDRSVYSRVRELTGLPVDVLLTHGHWDHAGAGAHDFYRAGDRIYLGESDYFFVTDPAFAAVSHGLRPEYFTPLREGMVFDLGDCRLETLFVPGHTPGSAVFLDPENRRLYTGDAIGAGVLWMHLPGALRLREFRRNLVRLWDRVCGLEGLLIHPGHRHQSPVQLDLSFLADTILTTDNIINRTWIGNPVETLLSNGQVLKCFSVSYNRIRDYCYDPERL